MKRPRAERIAALRAVAAPPLRSRSISRSRGSSAASRRNRAREPSIEASSTRIISQSVKLWARTEAMVAAMVAAAFQTGVTIETFGTASAASPALSGSRSRDVSGPSPRIPPAMRSGAGCTTRAGDRPGACAATGFGP